MHITQEMVEFDTLQWTRGDNTGGARLAFGVGDNRSMAGAHQLITVDCQGDTANRLTTDPERFEFKRHG
ncbi:hypothetical protein [Rhizobacter sp. Root404]|uniref:hypothetical protein n=1 Tax=Rhizobacter sp. Root404 TaxID=1736528 RepID=UPI0006F90DAD|nr:hypothetical protein [Rhizobacter sp. Root404]KQW36573.1 hypothetical protein ASC76_18125 [Rhizobacter sp. Root404]